jgi:hypothetical protein
MKPDAHQAGSRFVDLGIAGSHSRRRVRNDNPFSEGEATQLNLLRSRELGWMASISGWSRLLATSVRPPESSRGKVPAYDFGTRPV